jgi:antitoxin (DNA-binding transcriptional repressor) of toxin-antitoxin stability system
MKTVTLKDNSSADDLLKQGADEEVVVLRDGHAIALLVPFDDDELEWYIRERNPAFIESIARARKQISEGNAIDLEDLKKEFEG